MPEYSFTLVIDGEVEAKLDALFEAGCSDAAFGSTNGVHYADFDREAETFGEVTSSAIAGVESVGGLRVRRIEPDELEAGEPVGYVPRHRRGRRQGGGAVVGREGGAGGSEPGLARPLTPGERHLLVGTLAGMRKGRHDGHLYWFETDPRTKEPTRPVPPIEPEDPAPYLVQVGNLVAVKEWDAEDPRCYALRFAEDPEGEELVAETVVGSHKEGGGSRMVWVFARDGELTGMEVF